MGALTLGVETPDADFLASASSAVDGTLGADATFGVTGSYPDTLGAETLGSEVLAVDGLDGAALLIEVLARGVDAAEGLAEDATCSATGPDSSLRWEKRSPASRRNFPYSA